MKVGNRNIQVSHLDKLIYPKAGITKSDIIDYYRYVANWILPHLQDRPIMMHRFPDGIGEDGFYQKSAGDYFPEWMTFRDIARREGGSVRHVIGGDEATLVYLANQASLEIHTWLSQVGDLEKPDKLVLDLDPPGDYFRPVQKAAKAIHQLCKEIDIPSFPMTTGSSGLHVVIPLKAESDFEVSRDFAKKMGERLVEENPDLLTLEQLKKNRKGRIYFDMQRNAYGQTSIAPYSLRALPNAPIATPLTWDEVGKGDLHPRKYHLRNIRRRLAQKGDAWEGWMEEGIDLANVEVI